MDANLTKLLEKIEAGTPLTLAEQRLALGLEPVKPIHCILVDDDDQGCCSS